jgi:hypothetical protein
MFAKRSTSAFVATTIGLSGVARAIGEDLCRPALTLNEVQFSGMTAPTLDRTWTAVVSVDASVCTEDSKGYFDIVFTRLSENAPDLEFREQFIWSAPSYVWPAPSVSVGVAFAADEAVGQYRAENITPCVCRD